MAAVATWRDFEAEGHYRTPAAALNASSKSQTSAEDNGDPRNVEALHLAVRAGQFNTVASLIEKRARINARARNGNSPLHEACLHGHARVASLLLERRSRVDISSERGGSQPIHLAAHAGHCAVLSALLRKRAKVAATDAEGVQPIHLAAQAGGLATVAALLSSRARPDAEDHPRNGEPRTQPLEWAVEAGDGAVVRLLVARLREVGAPLIEERIRKLKKWAAQLGHVDCMRCLEDLCPKCDTQAPKLPLPAKVLVSNADLGIRGTLETVAEGPSRAAHYESLGYLGCVAEDPSSAVVVESQTNLGIVAEEPCSAVDDEYLRDLGTIAKEPSSAVDVDCPRNLGTLAEGPSSAECAACHGNPGAVAEEPSSALRAEIPRHLEAAAGEPFSFVDAASLAKPGTVAEKPDLELLAVELRHMQDNVDLLLVDRLCGYTQNDPLPSSMNVRHPVVLQEKQQLHEHVDLQCQPSQAQVEQPALHVQSPKQMQKAEEEEAFFLRCLEKQRPPTRCQEARLSAQQLKLGAEAAHQAPPALPHLEQSKLHDRLTAPISASVRCCPKIHAIEASCMEDVTWSRGGFAGGGLHAARLLRREPSFYDDLSPLHCASRLTREQTEPTLTTAAFEIGSSGPIGCCSMAPVVPDGLHTSKAATRVSAAATAAVPWSTLDVSPSAAREHLMLSSPRQALARAIAAGALLDVGRIPIWTSHTAYTNAADQDISWASLSDDDCSVGTEDIEIVGACTDLARKVEALALETGIDDVSGLEEAVMAFAKMEGSEAGGLALALTAFARMDDCEDQGFYGGLSVSTESAFSCDSAC